MTASSPTGDTTPPALSEAVASVLACWANLNDLGITEMDTAIRHLEAAHLAAAPSSSSPDDTAPDVAPEHERVLDYVVVAADLGFDVQWPAAYVRRIADAIKAVSAAAAASAAVPDTTPVQQPLPAWLTSAGPCLYCDMTMAECADPSQPTCCGSCRHPKAPADGDTEETR